MGSRLLDRDGALERIGGDEELYSEVIDIFLEDVPVQLEALRKAFVAGDRKTGERQAHSLKSAAANIGAELMRDVCLKAEQSFASAESSELEHLIQAIASEFEKVQHILRAARPE